MSDLFDDFMRELQRRRSQAEGKTPGSAPDGDGNAADAEPGAVAPDADVPEATDHDTPVDDVRDDDGARGGDGGDDDADDRDPSEPVPLRPRHRSGSGRRTGSHPSGARSGAGGPPGAPRSPRPVGGPDDGTGSISVGGILRRVGLVVAIVVVAIVVLLAGFGVDLWTDAIWYKSVGFDGVFWTRLGAQVGLFVVGAVVALVLLLGNLWLAGRLAPPPDPEKPGRLRAIADRLTEAQRQAERSARMGGGPGGPFGPGGPGGPFGAGMRSGRGEATTFGFDAGDLPDLGPMASWAIAGFALLLAIGIGGAISGAWDTILLWVNRVPYSTTGTVTDPVFGKDISFFLFELPFFRLIQSLLTGILLASLAVVGARYLVAATRGGEVFITRVRVHLAVIAGLYLLCVAFGYQLDKYELVYSHAGVATGVSFTDANARFMAYDVLTFLSGIAGALLIAAAFTRWIWPLGLVVGVWLSASVILGGLYPEAIQRFTVDPNTYAQEEQYIANNIAMTRLSFGLNAWETKNYSGAQPLTEAAIRDEADTFTNARLWDYRPLQTTLDQLQTVRQYYDFWDVDTDRYVVDGTLRQVMLSGRELAISKNPSATSWVNERVIYTHGIGVAMVPVNEVTKEGQPQLWIRDLPPVSSSGAPAITQPRIYFGESDDHYVVVRAAQAEFDYPRGSSEGSGDETTSWTGTTGVPLDSTLNRLLYALRFKDLDLLISDQIRADSQLLFHRTLSDRLGLIAPFLRYDKDPYIVVDGAGHLVYVQDAYTVSNRFPNASGFDTGTLGPTSGLAGTDLNYIRNSVKITMDAYDGTMKFYVADPTDPIVRAWQGIFPTLFHPMSDMPAGIVPHLRVPEELFNVQTRMYGQYHVVQPLTFFNNTDRWTVPDAQTNEQSLPSEAYYVVMRMPGEPVAEFLLLQPMIAASRPNMIAWVAARNDGTEYGKVRAYQFPSDTTIFGPAQIEARIDQNPTISGQVTLWNQSGSRVIRGNLIVVPVGDSLIYLQPVYLQSTSAAFPEFQKIVVASPTTVVWGNTLGEALTALLVSQNVPVPGSTPAPGPTATPGTGPTATPGTGPTASPGTGPTASPGPTLPPDGTMPTDLKGLIAYANQHYDLAQAALRNGDFATYGVEMDKVKAALQKLDALTAPGASQQP
ncbi:MAG TPA: UPF0182 family protein [Candidatus Limnocylindrales bacterium]